MARNRNAARQEAQQDTSGSDNATATKERTHMANALTAEQIAGLLAGSKQRGEYDRELKLFMESGEAGIQIPLDSGTFAEKKPSSVKTGFTNAAKREGAPEGAGNVAVIVNEDQVYLVRRDLVGQEA